MPSLDEDFSELIARLGESRRMAVGGGDPFFYFPYEPSQALEIRRLLSGWEGRLRNAGFRPKRVSFSKLLWDAIEEAGRWDEWLEFEHTGDFDAADLNSAIRSVLDANKTMINKVLDEISSAGPNGVVLFVDTEALHPFFRVRTLESDLHDRVSAPTIVLYPGRRSGQYGLKFLDLYPEDGNYRATIVGGLT